MKQETIEMLSNYIHEGKLGFQNIGLIINGHRENGNPVLLLEQVEPMIDNTLQILEAFEVFLDMYIDESTVK